MTEENILREALRSACRDFQHNNPPPSWVGRNTQDFIDYYVSMTRQSVNKNGFFDLEKYLRRRAEDKAKEAKR